MTRRKKQPVADPVVNMLGPLDGAVIPGGCDECDEPYQTVERVNPGVWMVNVHHDDWCPRLHRLTNPSS